MELLDQFGHIIYWMSEVFSRKRPAQRVLQSLSTLNAPEYTRHDDALEQSSKIWSIQTHVNEARVEVRRT